MKNIIIPIVIVILFIIAVISVTNQKDISNRNIIYGVSSSLPLVTWGPKCPFGFKVHDLQPIDNSITKYSTISRLQGYSFRCIPE